MWLRCHPAGDRWPQLPGAWWSWITGGVADDAARRGHLPGIEIGWGIGLAFPLAAYVIGTRRPPQGCADGIRPSEEGPSGSAGDETAEGLAPIEAALEDIQARLDRLERWIAGQ